jgi:phosphate uptake regulator
MREAASHRLRLDKLRFALDAQAGIILQNLEQLQAYLAGPSDSPLPSSISIREQAAAVRKECLLMMTRQAPMASDLKYTLAALRVGQDYERLQELVESLSERFEPLRRIGDPALIQEVSNILGQIVCIHSSMRATWSKDVYDTESVAADPAASALISVIKSELKQLQARFIETLLGHREMIIICAELVLTCRHLQRMTELLEGLPVEMHCFEQPVKDLLPLMR